MSTSPTTYPFAAQVRLQPHYICAHPSPHIPLQHTCGYNRTMCTSLSPYPFCFLVLIMFFSLKPVNSKPSTPLHHGWYVHSGMGWRDYRHADAQIGFEEPFRANVRIHRWVHDATPRGWRPRDAQPGVRRLRLDHRFLL